MRDPDEVDGRRVVGGVELVELDNVRRVEGVLGQHGLKCHGGAGVLQQNKANETHNPILAKFNRSRVKRT